MTDPQVLQLIASWGSLVSILAIGAKLIRHAARVEMKIDVLWAWFKKEHGIDDD